MENSFNKNILKIMALSVIPEVDPNFVVLN